jgi:hypothetical protein
MHKSMFPLQLSIVLITLQGFIIQAGGEVVVNDPSFTIEIVKSSIPTEVVIQEAAESPCRLCTVKNVCQDIVSLCRKHPIAVAACIAVVAAVVAYNIVPGAKEKINALFEDPSYQQEDMEFDTHILPQEKIDEARQYEQ